MPAIWFGTVILWTVLEGVKQEKEKQKKTDGMYKAIKHKDTQNINVYVPDDIESEEAKPKIIAEYIKQKKDPDLWEAYGKGLLQVYDIDKTIVTPPRISSDDR